MLPLLETPTAQFLDALRRELESRGHAATRWKVPFWGEGLSVPFSDGCDRWFFPFLSSPQVVPRPSSQEVEGLADNFEAVNAARAAVLRGVRFFLAARGWATREWGGHWNWQAGIVSGSLDVSRPLTRAVRKHSDRAEALREFCRDQLGWGDVPSLEQARQFLESGGEPPRVAWKDDAVEPAIALAFLAFDEKGLDAAAEAKKSGLEVADAAFGVRHELGFGVVQKLIERLGAARFSTDMKGRVSFEFSDGADEFSIFPRRRAWRKSGEAGEVERLADELEAKFWNLDRARARFLNGWLAWAQERELTIEKTRNQNQWRAGITRHELTLKVGRPLTLKLERRAPEAVLGDWISQSTAETPADSQLALWCDAIDPQPREANLDALPGEYRRLMNWNEIEAEIAFLDEWAEVLLEAARNTMLAGKDPFYDFRSYPLEWWNHGLWYRGPRDAWADDEFWLEVMRRHPNDYGSLWRALRGDEEAENVLRVDVTHPNVENYWWESFDDFVLLFFRSELGFVIDDWHNESGLPVNTRPHAVFPLPPDIGAARADGLRHELQKFEAPTTLENAAELIDLAANLDRPAFDNWFDKRELAVLKTAFAFRVRAGDPNVYSEEFWLALAVLEWPDIADLVERSPKTAAQLASHDDTCWEDFLLGTSLVRPSRFVAQLSASFLTERAFAPFSDADAVKHGAEQFRQAFKKQHQLAAAIAWKRCRAAGIVR